MSTQTPSNNKGSSLWNDAWFRLRQNKLSMAGLVVIVIMILLCFVGRWLVPHDPRHQQLDQKFESSSAEHWLGMDQLGRDLFVRILDGGQISLLVAILATILTVTVGVIYGGIAGYVGGRTHAVMMRIVDGLLAMPFLIIVILFRELISAQLGNAEEWFVQTLGWKIEMVRRISNLIPLILAIAAFGWLTMGRIVCSSAAAVTKLEFIEAARSLGLSHRRILFRHILPNIMGPVIIYATLTIPTFILYEATLSFIGLGIEPPNASWGTLIKEGANYLETRPSLLLFPAAFFSVTLFAFNFLGDGLRDALDPKSSKD